VLEGDHAGPRRLPFSFEALAGVGRLALEKLPVGSLIIDRLELDIAELGTDPGTQVPERYQRKRTRLRSMAIRLSAQALDERVAACRKHLSGLGITQLSAKMNDGFVSVRARAADGLAAADVSFRVHIASAGTHLRALASTVRVHGHLPTPGPIIVDRILAALLGATDAAGVVERPHVRGLCDVEIDVVGALLWQVLPPAGWRLPSVGDVELVSLRIGRSAIELVFGPAGSRTGDLGVRPHTHQLAAAHDLMHSADQQLRDGHLEEAMRGYRSLLASGGPEQPLLLERILALAAARPAWFFDGLELSRQALGRWANFPPALAALASITLAQGDAREAAGHLAQLAHLASGDGDDDQAALAALAGARLLRVLDPKQATVLYQLALEHDPSSSEAADSLADRLADEQRWSELVRLVRARAVTTDPVRAVQLRLRLADVFIHQLDDPASAQQELAVARHLAPDDAAVHEMTATVLSAIDPIAAIAAWREVARLAEARGDHRTTARALATIGDKLSAAKETGADDAWREALELDPLQADALAGLAFSAAQRGDHEVAASLFERLRGLGLLPVVTGRHELAFARSLIALGRSDDARQSLRRATQVGGETAAEAHAILAEVAEAADDREHAAAELDTAIGALISLDTATTTTRAAELAMARAALFDRGGNATAADGEWMRAHELAARHSPQIARDAARTMLARVTTPPPISMATAQVETNAKPEPQVERRWIDAVLATRPPAGERAQLLVRRAAVRRGEKSPDIAAAIADLHEALRICEAMASNQDGQDPEATKIRREAYQLEADFLAQSGDQRARAQALAALARMAERGADRVAVETAAAAAWLAADEPAAALPHGARALAALEPEIPLRLRRDVLITLGEAAWRQRAWADVIRAYRGLLSDLGDGADAVDDGGGTPRLGVYRYRLAVAADRTGDAELALTALRPLVNDPDAAHGATPELRGQALRLYADLAERAGDLGGAATALEGFSALAVDSSPSARADAMYRAGELFRRADRPEDAIRCLEASLRISDTHMPALDALELAWRERGDNERVSVILGRKVAATARHPARQKPLLSRLGDLQDQLGRPDVALATHQRALEIDASWRPSLRYVTLNLKHSGQLTAAAGGLAQLAGELPSDAGVDLAVVARERQIAANALAELVVSLDAGQLIAVENLARPALERASVDGVDVAAALARLRGEAPQTLQPATFTSEESTQAGRTGSHATGALSLRDAALRARLAGKLDDAFATLEAANHVNPNDTNILQPLVEVAVELGDHEAAVRHLTVLADLVTGSRRGNALLELAELYYDHIDDATRGRQAMRAAAEAFGSGARRDATLRMLASEARANLAWDTAVNALDSIAVPRRTATDITDLAQALVRAGRDGAALALVEDPSVAEKLDDGGVFATQLRQGRDRKAEMAASLEVRADADTTRSDDASALRDEARSLRTSADPRTKTWPGAGEPSTPTPPTGVRISRIKLVSLPKPATPIADEEGFQSVSDPRVTTEANDPTADVSINISRHSPIRFEDATVDSDTQRDMLAQPDPDDAQNRKPPTLPPLSELRRPASSIPPPPHTVPAASRHTLTLRDFPSVPPPMGGPSDQAERARAPTLPPSGRATAQGLKAPTIPPVERRTTLRDFPSVPPPPRTSTTERERLLAAHQDAPSDAATLTALVESLSDRPAQKKEVLEAASRNAEGTALAIALFELALIARESHELIRAAALLSRAHEVAPSYAPVWMPLADVLAASDEIDAARELYEKVSVSQEYDERRRTFAAERAEALGFDPSVVSGEIKAKVPAAPPLAPELSEAQALVEAGKLKEAVVIIEKLANAQADNSAALEMLEQLYLKMNDITAASDAIGRQLLVAADEQARAQLWRRRAKLYRDTLDRDAEAYRCLKEAHACAPADAEIAYQLRTAAMVRGEWPLAASLLYREIAAAQSPRDRGALHLELALIFDERLDDEAQAQVNFEQALAFDPSIPAAKLPLARRYESTRRFADAAKLYDEAAATARAGDRARLLEAAQRCRAAAGTTPAPIAPRDLNGELIRAISTGDSDAALDLAHQVWRAEPGHPGAFRVLANVHRTAGDLVALSELTSVRTSRADNPEDRASAWLEVARLAEELGALDQAARAYDNALVEDPGHTGALDARGSLAFKLGDWATADTIYRDINASESLLDPDELALRRSLLAEKLGRESEALSHALAAAELAPTRAEAMRRVQELATRIGELDTALGAARAVLDLLPLDDEDAKLRAHFGLVELMREAGNLGGAVAQLERVLRENPQHIPAMETLVEIHTARNDWASATRVLYQLVPLAPTAQLRAERLYRLGEVVLVHLGDVDRADDVFLRASDLDPSHVPTLRRLLDVYWRADDPGALVEVATELSERGALSSGPTSDGALAHALVAAALIGDTALAQRLAAALGDEAARQVATALSELGGREGRLQLASATTAVAELARRGTIDLGKLRAAAIGTPVANLLSAP
jgi:Tfp pilus assembly protein PilF